MLRRLFGFIKRLHLKMLGPGKRAKYMRKHMHFVGNNVLLYTTHFGTEPYLISLHDNCVCAADVKFITHDISVFNLSRQLEDGTQLDKVGSIELFENCFIGAYSVLMPNTSVGKNSIVAAGSVVTKRIPDGEVWGGNPAKFIMKTQEYIEKMVETNKSFPWMPEINKLSEKELKAMREKYFFDKEWKL